MSTTFNTTKNWAASTLASALGAEDLTLTVASGEGALFGSTFPMIIVLDYNLPSKREVVKATGRAGDVINIEREQEDTTGVAHAAGASVRCNLTAGQITDIQNAVNTLEVGLSDGELHLTPKSSSSGVEGTIFYNSDDDAVYVGTE
jgi:hypothetical protein